ncbi:MAG: hypothetical protein Q7S20_13725 [Gemmatimonadaceae bacterium]|nr:hypothetical protein [Gemmatimonadaceae bacterium]
MIVIAHFTAISCYIAAAALAALPFARRVSAPVNGGRAGGDRMNEFLHEPSLRLRAAAANGRGLGVVDAARYLFALERDANGTQPDRDGDA